MEEEVTKVKIPVPRDLTPDQRLEVATQVLQYIHDRTQQGLGKNGNPWKGKAAKYSESYKRSSKKSEPVDLTLSREMLGKMKYFRGMSQGDHIVIGFTKGSKVAAKAEGNILGTYGQPKHKPIPGKARPFLDIGRKDMMAIQQFIEDSKDD